MFQYSLKINKTTHLLCPKSETSYLRRELAYGVWYDSIWACISNQQGHELWFGIRLLNFDQGYIILHVMLCHQILGGTTRCEGCNIIYYNWGNIRP